MDYKNIIIGIVLIIILYLVYVYIVRSKNSLIPPSNISSIPNNPVTVTKQINCAYSMWLFISQWDTSNFKRVLTRYSDSRPQFKVYLDKLSNNLILEMCNSDSSTSKIVYNNFPIQAWTNLVISLSGDYVDLYINGKLVKSTGLDNLLDLPTNKIYLGGKIISSKDGCSSDSGVNDASPTNNNVTDTYTGFISTLSYFPKPITPNDAWSIYTKGYDKSGLDSGSGGKYKLKVSVLDNNREMNSIQF